MLLLWLLLAGIRGGELIHIVYGLVVNRVNEPDGLSLGVNKLVNLAATVPELIGDTELHQHILSKNDDFHQSCHKA